MMPAARRRTALTSPLTVSRLRFPDAGTEAAFRADYVRRSLAFSRAAVVLSVVLYAAFGILDRLIVPDVATTIWVIRFAVVCPIGLGVFALSFTDLFRRWMQPILAAYAVVLGLGIVAMIAIADTAAGHFYYAGLLLVIPFTYTFVQLRFTDATRAVIVIIASYEVVAIWIKATPIEILVNNNFFFLSSVIISMAAGYSMERGARSQFLQRRVIDAQRRELADQNKHLDSALQASLTEVQRQADELRASRVRIVSAADDARRRIERDLHDGAQQRLIGVAVRLRLAASALAPEDERTRSMLMNITQEVGEAADELRNLAHGIYPPLLSDEGLGAALGAAGRRAPLTVVLDCVPERRYDRELEATVYFCALEALQNATKYAGSDALVTISIVEAGATLRFQIADDGVGFDADGSGVGAGFLNMSDRIGTLGGILRVDSRPGHGTTVVGELPLGPRAVHAAEGLSAT